MKNEDFGFPYKAPSAELKSKYKFLETYQVLPRRNFKRFMDIVISTLVLVIGSPFFLIFWLAYKAEGILNSRAKGSILYYYWAVSKGHKIKKWKVRQFYWDCVEPDAKSKARWEDFLVEWDAESQTFCGKIAKRTYLDEIPQFFSVLLGQMTLVGPRPLCVTHYNRDLKQGNYTRSLLPGGIVGFGHIRKGTSNFGDPSFEFEYASIYLHGSTWELFKLDNWVMLQGLKLMIKAEGL